MYRARRSRQDGFRPKLIALSVAACFSVSATQSLANPTGPTVTSGSAGFNTAGNTLTVTNSANAIINWQGFSIGVNEITRFLQSSSASAVLNRVIGSGGVIPQSVIDGVLSSNGRVFLLNPSGVAIGSTATINVAGLVASSLNLSDQDFLNGRMHFGEVPGAGAVVNNGTITTTSGGRVFLVAPDVQNTGIITSPQGQIVLAAGKSVDLVSEDSPFVTVKVTADSQQALNLGTLSADSGRIDMAAALVRNTGIVAANSAVVGEHGEIRLVATKDVTLDAGSTTTANGLSGGNVLVQAQNGTNLISGTVEAKGSSGTGGTVQALGVRVGVIGNGVIDASGDTGGGTVLFGGDAHGANPNVQNAQQAFIGSNGVIRADAGTTGDGGRVVVWSDQYTQFYGSISARGGSQSGNGGFVETSGATLNATGRVDTRAPNGKWGTWLLDPTDLIIEPNGFGSGEALTSGSGFTADPNGEPAHITEATIESGFSTSGQVTLQAGHDVSFMSDLNLSYGSPGGTFTVQAMNNIDLAADGVAHTITTNGQNVTLSANDNGQVFTNPVGTGSIIGSGNFITSGGNLTLLGYGVTVGTISTSATSGGVSGGNVTINALAGGVQTGSISTVGANGIDGSGNVSLATNGGDGGSVNISVTGGGGVNIGGDINTSGGNGGNGFSGCDCQFTSSGGGSGGFAGSVTITADSSINAQSVTTRGGNGGAGADDAGIGGPTNGGSGGGGSSVFLTSYGGNVMIAGSIVTTGGSGTNGGSTTSSNAVNAGSGGSGSSGGTVDILGSSVSVNGSILTQSGSGGSGGSATGTTFAGSGGDGGEGGHVNLSGTAGVTVGGSIDISGGNAGNGGDGAVGYGGNGGITFQASGVSIFSPLVTVAGPITARGGNGGNGGAGGGSGETGAGGALVTLGAQTAIGNVALDVGPSLSLGTTTTINSTITVGSIDTSGGMGGAGGSGGGSAGNGGGGGQVLIEGSNLTVGDITARGADGGAGGAGTTAINASFGGTGGNGGLVRVLGISSIDTTTTPATIVGGPVAIGNINASAGNGGVGGKGFNPALAGDGGAGGSAQSVIIYGGPIDMTKGGTILAMGGNGGAGGNGDPGAGGAGGTAGTVSLSSGSSIFVLKPLVINGISFAATPLTTTTVSGGAGGAGGIDLLTGLVGAAGATGGTGTIDILGQIMIVDPLSIPEVSFAYNGFIDGTDKSTQTQGALVPPDDPNKKKDDDKKKGVAVCK